MNIWSWTILCLLSTRIGCQNLRAKSRVIYDCIVIHSSGRADFDVDHRHTLLIFFSSCIIFVTCSLSD